MPALMVRTCKERSLLLKRCGAGKANPEDPEDSRLADQVPDMDFEHVETAGEAAPFASRAFASRMPAPQKPSRTVEAEAQALLVVASSFRL